MNKDNSDASIYLSRQNLINNQLIWNCGNIYVVN